VKAIRTEKSVVSFEYQACDGTVFEDATECRRYEHTSLSKKYLLESFNLEDMHYSILSSDNSEEFKIFLSHRIECSLEYIIENYSDLEPIVITKKAFDSDGRTSFVTMDYLLNEITELRNELEDIHSRVKKIIQIGSR